MKKRIQRSLSILLGLGFILAMPAAVSALPDGPETPRFVSGIVGTNTDPEANADVSATCGDKTKSHKANAGGFYLIQFTSKDCPDGSIVTITATKGDKTGTVQKTINGNVTTANIPIAIPVVPAPEMGTIVSVAALALGGGALFYFRRQKLAHVQSTI